MFMHIRDIALKTKVWSGVGIIVVLGLAAVLYMYHGLGELSRYLDHLANADVPFAMATIEMEKNSEEYSNGVLRYLRQPQAGLRTEAENDHVDFLHYLNVYMSLSDGPRKRAIGQQVAADHAQLYQQGNALMDQKDALDDTFFKTMELLEQIDDIVDERVSSALDPSTLTARVNIEAETAEFGLWLSADQREFTPVTRRRVVEKIAELEEAIDAYRRLPLNAAERGMAERIANLHAQAGRLAHKLLRDQGAFVVAVREFITRETDLDDLFDGPVEELTKASLAHPQERAEAALQRKLVALWYVIPLYAFIALTVGLLLILMVMRPLRRLMLGTQAIGAGNLDYRVPQQRGDEFGDLARKFNTMASQLQETTVSKSRLEASEHELRLAVASLREEIAEREKAEREREKLQRELRRNEAMATVGAIVVGVAHEVRNPLFGISSTLDAMQASSDPASHRERYQSVLRHEVDRLKRLMTELLDYGRPVTEERTPAQLAAIVAEAVRICQPGADAARVTLDNGVHGAWQVQCSRGRLVQVFVNLIDNAVQYAPPRTDVTITAQATRDEDGRDLVECRVRDHGGGFAAADLAQLFTPFFTRRRKGTGLGLSIVARIVDEHEGSIEASNAEDGGAVMSVRLPLLEGVARLPPIAASAGSTMQVAPGLRPLRP